MESQATDLFQLAGTLVVDLRLDKSPDPLSGRPLSFIPDALRKVKGLKRESHTLDDMRAMLGFAYLDSMLVPSEITQVVSSLSQTDDARTGSQLYSEGRGASFLHHTSPIAAKLCLRHGSMIRTNSLHL